MFDAAERVALLTGELEGVTCRDGGPVEVIAFDGLLVDLCRERATLTIVKGLRDAADLAIEQRMAQMNRQIGDVETVFLATAPCYSHLASSFVREIARFGGRLDGSVSPTVAAALLARVAEDL
jgi:pantetheine-phosphate adenylyltransferase